jgi:hypothetical protein
MESALKQEVSNLTEHNLLLKKELAELKKVRIE